MPPCKLCRFWKCRADMPGVGECHRKPPKLLPPVGELDRRTDAQRTRWPLTTAEDWCGKHERRE